MAENGQIVSETKYISLNEAEILLDEAEDGLEEIQSVGEATGILSAFAVFFSVAIPGGYFVSLAAFTTDSGQSQAESVFQERVDIYTEVVDAYANGNLNVKLTERAIYGVHGDEEGWAPYKTPYINAVQLSNGTWVYRD